MERLIREFWPMLLPTALGFAAVYFAAPRVRGSKWALGAMLGGGALAVFILRLGMMNAIWQERMLFLIFSAVALAGGFMLVTHKNPAYAALSFTLVIIASCGLFLLNGAPFLMAATIIIYAGAILVTFLFVLMLAQQAGISDADARTREPFLACLAGFILLGALLSVIQRTYDQRKLQPFLEQARRLMLAQDLTEAKAILVVDEEARSLKFLDDLYELMPNLSDRDRDEMINLEVYLAVGNLDEMSKIDEMRKIGEVRKIGEFILNKGLETGNLFQPPVDLSNGKSKPIAQSPFGGTSSAEPPAVDPKTGRPRERLPAANVDVIGRSLFTEYLIPVLGAAVLLLVATIGAIVIAGRTGEVLR